MNYKRPKLEVEKPVWRENVTGFQETRWCLDQGAGCEDGDMDGYVLEMALTRLMVNFMVGKKKGRLSRMRSKKSYRLACFLRKLWFLF